jgi:hypothetical protein
MIQTGNASIAARKIAMAMTGAVTAAVGTSVRTARSRPMAEAKENEIVAAIAAVCLAGFLTFLIWAIVG